MSQFRDRLAQSIAAHGLNLAAYVGIQMANVPLFLNVVGVEGYGFWVLLSTVPAYFAMADGGVLAAASTKMSLCFAKSEFEQAQETLHSSLSFMLVAMCILGFGSAVTIMLMKTSWFNIEHWKPTLLALILASILALFMSMVDGVCRVVNQYATGIHLHTFARTVEWIGMTSGLLLGRSLIAAALGALAGRALGLAVSMWYVIRIQEYFRWGVRSTTSHEIRSLMRPSLAFLGFPLSNAISIQGPLMMIGSIFGPNATAMFAAYRTVARSMVQFVGLFSHPLLPEFSRMYATSNRRLPSLIILGTLACTLIGLALGASIYFAMPFLLTHWTNSKIPMNEAYCLLVLCGAVLACVWHVPRTFVLATNNHGTLAVLYLTSSSLLLLAIWLAPANFGVTWVLFLGAAFELVMVVISCICARRVLNRAFMHPAVT